MLAGLEPFSGLRRVERYGGIEAIETVVENYNKRRSESCIRLSRSNLRFVDGLLKGHYRLIFLLFRMGGCFVLNM